MLEAELQQIYDSEINVCIPWLWDGGIEVKLGDDMNGFAAEAIVKNAADILPWLQQAIAAHLPESQYHIERMGGTFVPAVVEPRRY